MLSVKVIRLIHVPGLSVVWFFAALEIMITTQSKLSDIDPS